MSGFKKQSCIKVLFFSPYFYPYISGTSTYPYRLFSDVQLHCKTTCLTFAYDSTLTSYEKVNDNLTIQRMPFLFRLSKGFISPSSFFYFWKEVKTADIVVINLPSVEGIFLALLAKCFKKPVIALLHCEVSLPFSLLNTVANFILNCGVYVQLVLANTIIVETKDYFHGKWPYTLFCNKTVEQFPLVNTSPSNVLFKKKFDTVRKKYLHIIGFCGRIATEKGIEVLIQGVCPLKDTILVFAGPTEKEVVGETAYYKKVQDLLIQKRVPHIFFGPLSPEQLSTFYENIDVLVLPSINRTEAFGMVQVEAMLRGTPVIASNLPGLRIPIQLTHMGILVAPNNPDEISAAVQTIINNMQTYSNAKLMEGVKKICDPQKAFKNVFKLFRLHSRKSHSKVFHSLF